MRCTFINAFRFIILRFFFTVYNTTILQYKNFVFIYFKQHVRKARIIRAIATANRAIPEARRTLSPSRLSDTAPVKVRTIAGIRQRKPRVTLIIAKRPE
jgi:hypothetical protein